MKNSIMDNEGIRYSRGSFELDFSSRYLDEESFDSYHFLMTVHWRNVAFKS